MGKTITKPKTFPAVPFGNYVVIEPYQHVGSIMIPQGCDGGPTEKGTVVAVGPGSFSVQGVRLGSDVKLGDFVLYKRGPRAVEISHDGEEYLAVPESDLVCALPQPKV